jgi:hypothetical protein
MHSLVCDLIGEGTMPEGTVLPTLSLIVNVPLTFDYDPNTQLLSVMAVSSKPPQPTGTVEIPAFQVHVTLLLTPEASQSLLSELPNLESLLLQASKGPTKPASVQ